MSSHFTSPVIFVVLPAFVTAMVVSAVSTSDAKVATKVFALVALREVISKESFFSAFALTTT